MAECQESQDDRPEWSAATAKGKPPAAARGTQPRLTPKRPRARVLPAALLLLSLLLRSPLLPGADGPGHLSAPPEEPVGKNAPQAAYRTGQAPGEAHSKRSAHPQRSSRALSIETLALVHPANPSAVGRFERLELQITLAGLQGTRFFDPEPSLERSGVDLSAVFGSPSGVGWSVPGYYDGTAWRIRFSPTELGTWTFTVTVRDPGGSATAPAGSFTCVPTAHPGFVCIAGRYLRFQDGTLFFGVGHNTGWQEQVDRPSFAEMAAAGENLLSFWMAMPWKVSGPSAAPDYLPGRAPIENARDGVGHYNQAACQYLDQVLAEAEERGVYLLPALWSHGQLRDPHHAWSGPTPGDNNWWYKNAYSTLEGGAFDPADFFVLQAGGKETEQWRLQRNFYRYVLARWGYSRAILGWVGLVEADGTNGGAQDPARVARWAAALRDWFREHDPYRASTDGRYPLTVSKLNDTSYAPELDLRTTDSYPPYTGGHAFDDERVAEDLAAETQALGSAGQPAFHLEFGAPVGAASPPPAASQPAFLHYGLWGAFLNGAACSPLLWTDGYDFPLLDADALSQLRILGEFAAGLDFLGHPAQTFATPTSSDSQVGGWQMGLADRGCAWIRHRQGQALGGQQLALSGLVPGEYQVYWYDVWSSGTTALLSEGPLTAASDGLLELTVPSTARADLALRFQLKGSGTITETLAVKRLRIWLDFRQPGRDRLLLRGWLPARLARDPEGRTVSLDVGGFGVSFLLNEFGSGRSEEAHLQLWPRRRKRQAGEAPFELRLRSGSCAEALADEGLLNADLTGLELEVVVRVGVDGEVFVTGPSSVGDAPLRLRYSARQGRAGRARLAEP